MFLSVLSFVLWCLMLVVGCFGFRKIGQNYVLRESNPFIIVGPHWIGVLITLTLIVVSTYFFIDQQYVFISLLQEIQTSLCALPQSSFSSKQHAQILVLFHAARFTQILLLSRCPVTATFVTSTKLDTPNIATIVAYALKNTITIVHGWANASGRKT
ncbi:unnamed protein product [Aphanomyces euteiches]